MNMETRFRDNPELYHPAVFKIDRTGLYPSCTPNWRLRQVEQYLRAEDGGPHSGYFLEQLTHESDTHVLNLLKLRHGETKVGVPYEWAWQCHVRNEELGCGTLIKALVYAGVPAVEIATLLKADVANIETFINLFWDLSPYGANSFMRRSLHCRFEGIDPNDHEAARYGLLMVAAWHGGREGVELVLTPGVGLTNSERQSVKKQLRALEERIEAEEYVSVVGNFKKIPSNHDRYHETLSRLAALPPCSNPSARREAFKGAMREIGEGVPVMKFFGDAGINGRGIA
jgi:hypothetical protein